MELIIAIDGFSACGKSTLAKQLAMELNYVFIDTGAMYRAITLYLLRHHVELTDEEAVRSAMKDIQLEFVYQEGGKSEMYLNGESVEDEIRGLEVSEGVSRVAAIKAVRTFAVNQQRAMGNQGGVVMDGRDIGNTVFPNADLKIFMTADKKVREQRRLKEMRASHPEITLEEVAANLEKRDYLDTHREESPLQQAVDARILDNTCLNREEQLALALKWVKEAREKKD